MTKRPPDYVDPEGRTWHPYSVEFKTPDGTFLFQIFAVSRLHAAAQLQDLRETATLGGRIVGRVDAEMGDEP